MIQYKREMLISAGVSAKAGDVMFNELDNHEEDIFHHVLVI